MSLETAPDTAIDLDQKSLLRRITDRIRRLFNLEEILRATVAEVSDFLKTDRVMVYQFHPDENGQVVAESIRDQQLPSLLGLNFPADDIPAAARKMFVEAQVRSIVDVARGQIGQGGLGAFKSDDNPYNDIQYRPVDPCHIEYLTAMGVKSSLVLPILHYDVLWGLFISHHSQPRTILESEIQVIQLVVDQLSVAIAQSILTAEARNRAQQEAAINSVASLLHSLSTIELQAALDETVTALQGSGGRLWIRSETFAQNTVCQSPIASLNSTSAAGELYTVGVQPVVLQTTPFKLIEQFSVWEDFFQRREYNVWATTNLYQEPSLRSLQPAFYKTNIRGILIAPLWYRQQLLGYLSVFREEVETEVLWAGQIDEDGRQLQPRLSFEVWKESKKGKAQDWNSGEVELIQSLGKQFATAIQQYETHQQLQFLNTNLEVQVEERTLQLKQATEQQRILFEVVTKMRQSLDLETIFATVTQELRRSLNADRVGIYRFHSHPTLSEGEIIAEDVLPEFSSALGAQIHNYCFGENEAVKRCYGQVQAVSDIHSADSQACALSGLAQFQVKALLTAPLSKGDNLWGLLCIYQCVQPRQWGETEIQFATQVAAQLGVALEQSDLLTQTQKQAEQLAQTLHDLRKTQSQLVQTEKMSSLGQLVAGVAHEINNPVNFIYGNLSHASDYTHSLLNLIETYQTCYPNPDDRICQQKDDIDLDFLVEDLPKTLTSMKIGADRIRQIVLSLRNFSRLDQTEMKPVDIHEGLDSTLLILQHRLKATACSSIELIKEYGELPLVECYAGQLNQVFMNVLSNAIDALEEVRTQKTQSNAPSIRIRTAQTNENQVLICIEDNGPGIPEEVQAQVFETFFTTKPIGKGTGMGLSISHEIVVDKHKGDFKCKSHPGQGTAFLIELPIRQSQ